MAINQRIMQYKLLVCLLALLSISVSELPRLPLYVGRSYDLLTGNPLSEQVDPGFVHSVFDFTYNKQNTTEDGKYLVPDGISHRKVSSCTFSTNVRTYRGTLSYSDELKTKATISGGYKGSLVDAAFSKSTSYQHLQKQTLESNISITHAIAECEAYDLSIDIFTLGNLLPNFVTGVIDSYKANNWEKFIIQFGTHFVYDVTMGGRATQQITYDFQSVSKLSSIDIDIDVAAKASFAKFFADKSFDWHKHEEAVSYAEKLSKTIDELYIGGQPPKDGDIRTWADHVIQNPMPIRYKVMQLSQLFGKIKQIHFNYTQAIKQFTRALDTYCISKKCKKPIPDKPKPPPATIDYVKSTAYGGNGGQVFQFSIPSTTINAMRFIIRHAVIIDNVQILLGDGVKKYYTPAQGGMGGSWGEWVVPEGQYVNQIEYRSSDRIDALTFITNTGVKSPHFGGGGGNYHLETFPQGYRIIGFYGRSGDGVDRLGFILGKTVYPSSGKPYIEVIKKLLKIK